MKAIEIEPELSKYTDSPVVLEQVARAKAILSEYGMPQQYYDQQAAKAKAATMCATLRAERQRQHLSQSQLAAKVNMQKEFISRIENGHVDVQLSTFLKVAEGLGLKMMVGI